MEQLYSWYVAGVVIYLEAYEGRDFKSRCVRLKMKLDDVIGGGERAAALFFAKRAPCSCLEEKKRFLKNLAKTSICAACNEIKDCTSLMRCGGCRVVQYCSENCQRADWPIHKDQCKTLRDICHPQSFSLWYYVKIRRNNLMVSLRDSIATSVFVLFMGIPSQWRDFLVQDHRRYCSSRKTK